MATGYQPHNFIRDCVAYTGTHDNDTIQGWFASADPVDTEGQRILPIDKRGRLSLGYDAGFVGKCGRHSHRAGAGSSGTWQRSQNERAVHCGAELAVAGIAGSVHRRTGTEDTSDDGAV